MIHIYTRTSTAEQAASDKTSLDEQEKLCCAAALLRGCEEPRIWRDEGVSGSVPLIKRPQGNVMLGTVVPGDFVIASKLDRLFRSAEDALVTTRQLHEAQVDVILLDYSAEPIMGSICGRLFFTMLAAFAEFERGRIRERIVDGKRAKRERGGFGGGEVAYGYQLMGKDHVEPYEPEMWLIGRARVLYAGGYSQQRIADNLNEAGYRTRQGTPFRQKQIARWLSRPAVPEEATAARPEPIERPASMPRTKNRTRGASNDDPTPESTVRVARRGDNHTSRTKRFTPKRVPAGR